jgi:hypothetical protein
MNNQIYSQTIGMSHRRKPSTNMKPLYVALVIIAVAILSALAVRAESQETFQLMTPERYEAHRQLIPATKESSRIDAKFQQALLYTKFEMESVYQYQKLTDLGNSRIGDAVATVFRTSFPLDADKLKRPNENEVIPWKKSGGLEFVPPDQAATFFGWWSPPNPDGGIRPMVFRREKLEADPRGFIAPIGIKGMAPVNQINFDVLVRIFGDGTKLPFEMRAILQELGDRDVERYLPKAKFNDMQDWFADHGVNLPAPKWIRYSAGQPAKFSPGNFVSSVITFNRIPVPRLDRTYEYCMPPIPMELAKEFLLSCKTEGFEPMDGDVFAQDDDKICYGVTFNDPNNWGPMKYTGSHVGSDNLSCARCHSDILQHVNGFGRILVQRHSFWIGGFCGIHTINPFDPESVGPPDTKDVKQRVRQNGLIVERTVKVPRLPELNPVLVKAGLVAWYDSKIHSDTVYRVMKEFDP